ncbi:MAG: phosphoribosylglycinamide formyltransferase [Mariniblastus sp.]|nr:phosphoribosylglycinamide formyltransferase [Mariniblastus sp.]
MPNEFKIAVLISGGGTTLKNLLDVHQQGRLDCEIGLVISSSASAGGLKFAQQSNIPSNVIIRKDYADTATYSEAMFELCRTSNIDLVVMGGFLKRVKIPADFINRVINIHPSLIPAFCGKGNYGIRVHTNVIEYGVKLSGCTVHYVDDHYDHGPIIAQETVPVLNDDEPETLAGRVFEKECQLYPEIVNAIANGRITVSGRRVVYTN